MQRFYCSVCRRVKRVRRTPIIISNLDSTNPTDRVGQCDKHGIYRVQTSSNRAQYKNVVDWVQSDKPVVTGRAVTNQSKRRMK